MDGISCGKAWAGKLSFLSLLLARSLQESALVRQTSSIACMSTLWLFALRGGAGGDDRSTAHSLLSLKTLRYLF